eukprot:g16171.t1
MANAAGGSRIRERPWAEDFEVESTRPASRPWYKKCVDSCKIFCLKLSGKKTVETMCPKCGALVLGEPYQRVDCPECALDFTCPKDSHTPARVDAELIWGNNTESDATLIELKRGQLEQNAQESEPESINHDHLHPPPVSKVIDETRKRKSAHDEKRKSADVNRKVLNHRLFGVQSVDEFEAGEADRGQGVGSAVHGGEEGKHSQELLLLSGSSVGVRKRTKKSRNIVGRRRTSTSMLRAKAEGEAVEGGLYLTDEDGESGVDTEVGSREGGADWTSGVDPGAHRRLGREQITMVDGFLRSSGSSLSLDEGTSPFDEEDDFFGDDGTTDASGSFDSNGFFQPGRVGRSDPARATPEPSESVAAPRPKRENTTGYTNLFVPAEQLQSKEEGISKVDAQPGHEKTSIVSSVSTVASSQASASVASASSIPVEPSSLELSSADPPGGPADGKPALLCGRETAVSRVFAKSSACRAIAVSAIGDEKENRTAAGLQVGLPKGHLNASRIVESPGSCGSEEGPWEEVVEVGYGGQVRATGCRDEYYTAHQHDGEHGDTVSHTTHALESLSWLQRETQQHAEVPSAADGQDGVAGWRENVHFYEDELEASPVSKCVSSQKRLQGGGTTDVDASIDNLEDVALGAGEAPAPPLSDVPADGDVLSRTSRTLSQDQELDLDSSVSPASEQLVGEEDGGNSSSANNRPTSRIGSRPFLTVPGVGKARAGWSRKEQHSRGQSPSSGARPSSASDCGGTFAAELKSTKQVAYLRRSGQSKTTGNFDEAPNAGRVRPREVVTGSVTPDLLVGATALGSSTPEDAQAGRGWIDPLQPGADPAEGAASSHSSTTKVFNPLYDKSRLRPVRKRQEALQAAPRKRTTRAYDSSSTCDMGKLPAGGTPVAETSLRASMKANATTPPPRGSAAESATPPERVSKKRGAGSGRDGEECFSACSAASGVKSAATPPRKESSATGSGVVFGGSSSSWGRSGSRGIMGRETRQTNLHDEDEADSRVAVEAVSNPKSNSVASVEAEALNSDSTPGGGRQTSLPLPKASTFQQKRERFGKPRTAAVNKSNTKNNFSSLAVPAASSDGRRSSLLGWYASENETSGKARKTSIALPVTPIALSDVDSADGEEVPREAASCRGLSEWYGDAGEGCFDDTEEGGTASLPPGVEHFRLDSRSSALD